jgi:hypothetical protein
VSGKVVPLQTIDLIPYDAVEQSLGCEGFGMNKLLMLLACLLQMTCTKKKTDTSDSNSIFKNVRVEEIAANRAVIKFDTTIPTTCEAQYGTSKEGLDKTARDPNMAEGSFELVHEVPVEDLASGTNYFYRAKAADASGLIQYSEIFSFATLTGVPAGSAINVASKNQGAVISEVSSNFGGSGAGNDSSWGANNAIDDSMNSEWASNGDGNKAYLVINLSREFLLTGVGFRSRKMSDGSSIITSFKLVFADQSEQGPFSTPDPDQIYTFDFETPVKSQQVRFVALTTTGGNTGAKAIQLFSREL